MGKRVLIVDDEMMIIKMLKSRLSAHHYDIETAADGVDALKKTVASPPDMIITDVLMPRMTGFEFLKALKEAGAQYGTIPVLVMSAKPSMKNFFDVWHEIEFLPKPFSGEVLLEKVERAIGKGDDPKTETVAPPQPPPVESSPPDTSAGKQAQTELKTVMLLGVEDYVVNKISAFFQERKCSVVVALDVPDAVKTARNDRPDIVLCQFWENQDLLNAPDAAQVLIAEPDLAAIPFYVYCIDALAIDAKQSFNESHVIHYGDTDQLLKEIAKRFNLKPPA
jgi:two-component system, chemotaxis family, chemotaxis protein CheY